jgi:hypothetical protein
MDLLLLLRVWSFIFRPQALIIQLSCCSYYRVSFKRTVCILGIALTVKHLLYWHCWLKTPLTFTRVIQKLKIQTGGRGREITAVKMTTLSCQAYCHSFRCGHCAYYNDVFMCCVSLKWACQIQIPPSVKCILLFDFSTEKEKLQLKFIVRLLVF